MLRNITKIESGTLALLIVTAKRAVHAHKIVSPRTQILEFLNETWKNAPGFRECWNVEKCYDLAGSGSGAPAGAIVNAHRAVAHDHHLLFANNE
jgi:hypothetical protein